MRAALKVTEDPKRWEEFLSSIISLTMPPEGKYVLADTYIELDARRVNIAQALNLLVRYLQEKKDAPADLIEVLRRNLPKYYVDQSIYHQRIRGISDPQVPVIPKDLAEYVPLGEEEKTARLFANVILPTQYDVRDKAGIPKTTSPHELSLFINEVVLHAAIHRTSMKDVLSYLDAPQATRGDQLQNMQNVLGFSSWSKEGEYAAMLLMEYLGKHHTEIEKYATGVLGKPLPELTIAEALNATLQMSPVGEFAMNLSKNAMEIAKGNFSVVSENIRTSLSEARTYAEEALQTALAPLAELKENATDLERDAFRKDVRELTMFFLTNPKATGSVRYLNSYIADLKGPQQKYARAIVEKVAGQDAKKRTIERLEQALLLPKEKKGDVEAEKIAAVIEKMVMEDRLTLRDAFQLYYFLEVSKGGQIPTAFITLHLMDERGGEWKTAINAEARLFRTYIDLARSAENIEDLEEKFREVGISEISMDTTEIKNLAQFLGERGLGEFSRWSYRLYAHMRKFPEFYIVTGAVTGTSLAVGAGLLTRKAYIAVSLSKFSEIADMTDDILIQKFGRDTEALGRAKLCRNEALALKTRYEISQLRFPRLREIASPGAMKDWILSRAERRKTGRLLARSAENVNTQDLGDIFTILKREHPDIHVLIDLAEDVGEDLPTIRSGLQKSGFTVEQVADAVKTRGIEQFTGRAQEIMEQIKKLEQPIEDVRERRKLLRRIEDAADEFRDDFNAFTKEFPDARRTIAKNLAEPGSELSEAFLEAVDQAHVQKRLSQKVGIFFDATISNEERKLAGRFMRLGLAGESDVLKVPGTLDELRTAVKAAQNGDNTMILLRRYAHAVGDPDVFRTALADRDIRSALPAKELAKLEQSAAHATTHRAKLLQAGGKFAGYALLAFGPLVDGYLIFATNKEIAEAEKQGNREESDRLKRKRVALVAEGGGAAAIGALTLAKRVGEKVAGRTFWVFTAANVSAEVLEAYAEDLNRTELREYRKRTPQELMGLLHGRGDWLLDSRERAAYRHELALDAYLLKTQTFDFTALDERYMREVIAELPAWQEKNLYDPETIDAMQRAIKEENSTKFRIAVAEFLAATGGIASPSPARMERATMYAELKYLERRSEDLGDPTILHDALYPIGGSIPLHGIASVRPQDIEILGAHTKLADALTQEKTDSLFQTRIQLRTLTEEGALSEEAARAEFMQEYASQFLAYDGDLFVSPRGGRSDYDRFPYEQTVNEILFYEVGPLFDKTNSPEAFAKEALALRNSLRTFLAAGKAFTPEEMDDGGTAFGPKMPKWYRKNALGIARG